MMAAIDPSMMESECFNCLNGNQCEKKSIFLFYQRYRPSNDEKNSGNDGRFIYQDVKYVPMADRFGPSGSSNFDSNVVSIGSKKRPVQPAVLPTFSTTTTRTPTVIIPSPQAPLPAAFAPKASPSASPSQANDLNGAIILRQEQEETVDGYRYL